MTDKSTETKSHADIDSIYDESIILSKPVMKRTVFKPEWLNVKTDISDNIISDNVLELSKPIMKRTVTKPEWSNTQTGTSDNILDNIPRPILRRHSPSFDECSPDCINTSNSIIDIIDNYNKKHQ